jgi:hypothetical protein
LQHLTQEIEELVAEEFPNQIKVLPVETLPKGKAALIDCADLVASGMGRKEHFKGKKWIDRLAETVFSVTGFDDPSDDGMLFKRTVAPASSSARRTPARSVSRRDRWVDRHRGVR